MAAHALSLPPSDFPLPESRVMQTYSQRLSDWAAALSYEDLPPAVIEHTRLRVLDVFGLVLAGLGTPFGRSVREAVLALNPGGPCRNPGQRRQDLARRRGPGQWRAVASSRVRRHP